MSGHGDDISEQSAACLRDAMSVLTSSVLDGPAHDDTRMLIEQLMVPREGESTRDWLTRVRTVIMYLAAFGVAFLDQIGMVERKLNRPDTTNADLIQRFALGIAHITDPEPGR